MTTAHAVPLPGSDRVGPQAAQPFRVLLAVNGSRITLGLIYAALPICAKLAKQLDILVINPGTSPSPALRRLRLHLKHCGTHSRMASTDGLFARTVIDYLHHFPGISTVVFSDLASRADQRMILGALCREGIHHINLATTKSLNPGPDDGPGDSETSSPRNRLVA